MMSNFTSKYFKSRQVLQISMLVLVSAVIFGDTLSNELVWDDIPAVADNRYIRDYKNIPLFFTPHYWNELHPYPGQYRPLRTTTLAVDYFFWELNPAGYRVTNLLLHIINVILVFYLVSVLISRSRDRRERIPVPEHVFLNLPFLTALFFAVHPVHTESINLIKNRSDLLAFLFFLLTFLMFIKHINGSGRMFQRLLIIGAWFCFIPALLSKEMVSTLPGVMALYAVCFCTGMERKKVLAWIAPYGVILLAYFWFMHSFIRSASSVSTRFPIPVDIGQHTLTVIKTLGFYFKMLLVPFPLNLDHMFGLPESVSDPAALLSLALLLLVGVFFAWSLRRAKIVFFSVGWMVLTLLPVANLIYLASRPIAEQRLYIPSFGFCLLLGYGIVQLSKIRTRRLNPARAVILSGVMAGVIASLYTVMTVCRNLDWRDEFTLYSRTLARNPDSARIHNNLAVALSERKDYEKAISHYKSALRLMPDYVKARYNLGQVFHETGRYEEAISHYQIALRLMPDDVKTRYNLGQVLHETGRYEEAIGHYRAAYRLDPHGADILFNMACLLFDTEQYETAIHYYQEAVRLQPDFYKAHNNLGVLLHHMGRLEEAFKHLQTAIQLNPDEAKAFENLGDVLVDMGRLEAAGGHYLTVLRLQPDYPAANFKIGNIYLKQGEPGKAMPYYLKAVARDPDNASICNNMGVALMRVGDIDKAASLFYKILATNPDNMEACYNLGVALMTRQHYHEALNWFSRVLDINPDHNRARRDHEFCMEMIEKKSVPSGGHGRP